MDTVVTANNIKKTTLVINGELYVKKLDYSDAAVPDDRVVKVKVIYNDEDEFFPETISWSNRNISDDTVCLLTFGLYNSTTVKRLDLSCNSITSDGAMAIRNCLKQNNTLKELNISHNYFNDDGAEIISNCLKCTTILYRNLIFHTTKLLIMEQRLLVTA